MTSSAHRLELAALQHRVSLEATPFPVECQLAYRVVSDAIECLEQRDERPFFLWLSFPEPHNPKAFLALMEERKIEASTAREMLHGGCLLCSEHKPAMCHRRLVAEYLTRRWGGVETTHLV